MTLCEIVTSYSIQVDWSSKSITTVIDIVKRPAGVLLWLLLQYSVCVTNLHKISMREDFFNLVGVTNWCFARVGGRLLY